MHTDYDSQIARFNFLARLKPVKIVSQLVQQMDNNKAPSNIEPQPDNGSVPPKIVPAGSQQQPILSPSEINGATGGVTKIEDYDDKESAEVDSD